MIAFVCVCFTAAFVEIRQNPSEFHQTACFLLWCLFAQLHVVKCSWLSELSITFIDDIADWNGVWQASALGPAKCHSSHRWLQRSPSSWKGSMASMRRYEAVLYLLSHSQLCPEKLLDSQESSYHRLRQLLCLVQRARIYWTSMEWVSFCSNCCKNVKEVYNFKTAKIRKPSAF